jgi:hypothetical protein
MPSRCMSSSCSRMHSSVLTPGPTRLLMFFRREASTADSASTEMLETQAPAVDALEEVTVHGEGALPLPAGDTSLDMGDTKLWSAAAAAAAAERAVGALSCRKEIGIGRSEGLSLLKTKRIIDQLHSQSVSQSVYQYVSQSVYQYVSMSGVS